MAKAPPRAPVAGPAFIRQLARLTDAEIPLPTATLSDRLGHWVDWNRALVLSKALDGAIPVAAPETQAFDDDVAAECARARTTLAESIQNDPLPATKPHGSAAPAPCPEFAPFRQRHQHLQRAILTATGRLRGRLRDMLAQQSAEKARLAEVDAVMEMTLSPREQSLLARVPDLLGEHFARLHARAPDVQAPPEAETPPAPAPWLLAFHHDMRQVLLNELDVRFHPIEALLAALRTP
ncbi:MAG: DUF3348 domain-containing protein [Pseudoxanthomonas sp.]